MRSNIKYRFSKLDFPKEHDESLMENIIPINNALSIINQLRGVRFNYIDTETFGTGVKLGLVAQEVYLVDPDLTAVMDDGLMGVHYRTISVLLLEAIKELSSGVTSSTNTYLETQTILAEDNNIELNYNGTYETAIGGGINILNAKSNGDSAEFKTDENGDWITNNTLKANELVIPVYTPSATTDTNGSIGSLTRNDDYLYLKTNIGWKRTNFENF